MTAHNSRKASKNRNESNNRTANTVWIPPKAGMLAKTVKPATAWREAKQQQRQYEHHSVNSRRETHNNKDARNSRN
jgi:hypothetical protein